MTDTQETRQQLLDRVFVLINDKGGVGKTTLACNLAGQLAAAGQRVLLIDLNRQGNCAEDLGYRDRDGVDDQGAGLLLALITGQPVQPAPAIRTGLDVVAGGTKLGDLTPLLTARFQTQGRAAFLALADALVPVATSYDAIVIDSPPENVMLEDLALAAGRWAIMPTRSDQAGLVGMQLTAERFVLAREVNPGLRLLGVALFATVASGTRIQAAVRDAVAAAFGGQPMLDAAIRYSERVAYDARRHGLLAHELEGASVRGLATGSASSVAGDYFRLTAEVLEILGNVEGGQAGADAPVTAGEAQ